MIRSTIIIIIIITCHYKNKDPKLTSKRSEYNTRPTIRYHYPLEIVISTYLCTKGNMQTRIATELNVILLLSLYLQHTSLSSNLQMGICQNKTKLGPKCHQLSSNMLY